MLTILELKEKNLKNLKEEKKKRYSFGGVTYPEGQSVNKAFVGT